MLKDSWVACKQPHYPELAQSRIGSLNLLPLEASFVLEAFSEIEKYLLRKKFV
jgi:hypothetical protein